jgi:hypothetical protein
MKKRFKWSLALFLVLVSLLPGIVRAQDNLETLQLVLIKNFGYGGFGKIQGNFTLKISDPPDDMESAVFYIDDELVANREAEPYLYKFHTSEFPDGEHRMYAEGFLRNGDVLESNTITKVFLSSDQAWNETQNLIGPILIGTAILTLLGVGVPVLFSRNKKFVLGKYGPAGGAVCRRCGLPFSRSIFSPNLAIGKLVRCPHCRRISVLPRESQTRLREAEAKFTTLDGSGIPAVEADDLNKLLEESRFED